MKYLRTFEQYQGDDFGRFNDDNVENATPEMSSDFDDFDDFDDENDEMSEEDDDTSFEHDRDKCSCPECTCGQNEDETEEDEPKRWGDEEIVEKKKMNAGFAAYLAKKKAGKKDDKKDDKKCDKKCSKCDDKKEEKGGKGLSAAQKKLPPALQKAILAKKKK